MAASIDGFITKHADGLVNWTSKEDKKHFSKITKEAGAVIYGKKTFATFNKPLPGRLNIVMTRDPDVSQNQEGILEFTNQDPLLILENLYQRGYKNVALGGGSEINKLFLEKDLIDEVYLTIEPRIFGSGKNIFASTSKDVRLELIDHEFLNKDSILLHYKVKR